MTENVTTIIITVIAVLGGGAAWKFYEFLIKNKREKERELLGEQTVYRDDLKKRVEDLENDKDELQRTILDMSIKLSAISVKVEFLQKENEKLSWTIQNKRDY
jgi:hypothetical protein